jgi:hypothetical protein
MKKKYLEEVTVYDPGLPGTRVLRFSCSGHLTQPGETPPNAYYAPRLKQPGNYRRDLFSQGTTSGESTTGFGETVLTNPDGGLDALKNYVFAGYPFVKRLGYEGAAYPSGFPVIMTGVNAQPEFSWSEITLRNRDREAELDQPLQTHFYAGNNALPNGLEGVEDLKNKPKPICVGAAPQISPPCVNSSKLTYQVHDGVVVSITPYCQGVASYSFSANYATSALLQAATVAAGTYSTCLAEGYFRLGSSPSGKVTADVVQGATVAARTVGQIAKAFALTRLSAGDIIDADITALDAANSAPIERWYDSPINVSDALTDICGDVGAWRGFDRLGKFRIQRLNAPVGDPAVKLMTESTSYTPIAGAPFCVVAEPEIINTADDNKGAPVWKVTVNYARNHTVQTSDLAGTITDARRALLAQEYQSVEYSAPDLLDTYPNATELVITTGLTNAAAALAEAQRLQALHGVQRDRLMIKVFASPETITLFDLGVEVSAALPRFGYDSGKPLIIIGIQPDYALGWIDLTLWG